MRPLMSVGALLATAAFLAACSSGPGPLGQGGTSGQQCMPQPEGVPTTVGLYDLHNSGSSPVTVHGISLPHDHGLTMTSSWLTPIYHGVGRDLVIGVSWPWPPSRSTGAGAAAVRWAWAPRKPLTGAVIKPHEDLNLVFGLTRTTARNSYSGGPVITYSTGGTAYTVSEKTTLEVAKSC